MTRGFRQSQATLHTWTGLLFGWVLFIVFLTGTAAYWREALNRWAHPELPRIEQPLAVLEEAQRFLERQAPNAKSWYIGMASEQSPGASLFWVPQPNPEDPAKRGSRRDNSALIGADGQSAARDTRGGDFFYRFHFDLHYMPVLWARWLVVAAALSMLVAILTGLVTHKKIFKDFFTLRRRKGQRSWLDGHNATAVLGLPFHLMITYTGLVTLASLFVPWALNANFPDEYGLYGVVNPGLAAVERTERPAQVADLSAIVRDAEQRLGGPVGGIEVTEPGDDAARVMVTGSSASTLSTYGARLLYDGVTGALLWRSAPPSAAATTFGAMIGLHAGRFGDTVLRWIYFLLGLGGTLMVASGLILWTVKRRAKLPDPTHPHLGFRIVERLNVSVIAGFPLGCGAYLLANRLLPVAMADRAELEIAMLFLAWGTAALFAIITPVQAGWTILLRAAAAFIAVPVAVDLLSTPGLFTWLRQGDWAMVGVDLVLLALAIGFAWAASLVARHQPQVRRRNSRTKANVAAESVAT